MNLGQVDVYLQGFIQDEIHGLQRKCRNAVSINAEVYVVCPSTAMLKMVNMKSRRWVAGINWRIAVRVAQLMPEAR